MAQLEMKRIKLGGLFSKKVKVIFEIKYEYSDPTGDIKSINMYDETGRKLGRLEFLSNGKRAVLRSFSMIDWSVPEYQRQLLKRFISLVKKEGVSLIEAELYDVDSRTPEKLQLFRNVGFDIRGGGSHTGYAHYYLTMKL